MRVIRQEDFKKLPTKKRRPHKAMVIVFAVFAVSGYAITRLNGQNDKPTDTRQAVRAGNPEAARKSKTLKTFKPEEFNQLATAVRYPNTQLFDEPPGITGNQVADKRIRAIAESRGYRLTSIPVGAIQKINEPRLEGDDLLQPLAAIGWDKLKKAAQKDGIPISLTSAYRSPEYQRGLFMGWLLAKKVSVAQIAAGGGDAAIASTLQTAAVPGYSRHHSGYTIDLWCDDGSGAFLNSACFRWIKSDNYKKAKQAGWIPSYPEGVKDQGPEPEPWEYIWVGEEHLLE